MRIRLNTVRPHMSDKRLEPTPSTLKRLFAVSGNRCAYPGCVTPVYDQAHDAILAEVAHIHGPTSDSPRWSSELSNEACRLNANLILLCPTHHSLVDQASVVYSADALRTIKVQHESTATPPQVEPASIGERLLQRYRDIQHRVRYAIIPGGSFGWPEAGGTLVREYPNGEVIPMPAQEAERFMAMRELSIELGTLPTVPPAQSTRTDEFSKSNRAVKILQLMLKYPDATFEELLQHAVTRESNE